MAELNNQVVEKKNETVNEFVGKIQDHLKTLNEESTIDLPQNYSLGNAVRSAYLKLLETKDKNGKKAMEVCTKTSITNAMLSMVIQGLSPAKSQCYFVVYGDQLTLMRSYMGTVAVTKRIKGVVDVKSYCIYEGDEIETEFDITSGTLQINKFNPKFENIDNKKILGAFAMIIGENGPIHTEIMTLAQIQAAWNQGASKGGSGAHKNFSEEMAKKSVINRACKMFVNTSDDADILLDEFNKTSDNDEIDPVKKEISSNANKELLDFEEEENKEIVEVEYKETEKEMEQVILQPEF
jgi:recombination protein RecT